MNFKIIINIVLILFCLQGCRQSKVCRKMPWNGITINAKGEAEIEVCSGQYYSRNFIKVEKGQEYSFEVVGHDEWTDLSITCGAQGFHNKLLREKKKRVRGENCFALCGTICASEPNNFAIRCGLTRYVVPLDGNLHFFANDHRTRFWYRNNRGSIKLKITRLK
ncbi:MAG: hypothetical protein K0S32_3225 [Bacteroidetes bacterium]|jgi:hypothetical protein|nr:hypothetical protein [Bacteroidota bacterium]